jgi:acetyltransferase-like isoleucine patch superfamily enzyme
LIEIGERCIVPICGLDKNILSSSTYIHSLIFAGVPMTVDSVLTFNQISDYVHISPNATLAGGVIVGEASHIAINAAVILQL